MKPCYGREETMTRRWKIAVTAAALLLGQCAMGEDESSDGDQRAAAIQRAPGAGSNSALAPGTGIAVKREVVIPGPCNLSDLAASPSRPNWTGGAATTQCGNLETDYGWLWQGMGGGVRQTMVPMSLRYGLTPKMDMRWGLPSHMAQRGGGSQALEGVSDQWLSTQYRFLEEGPKMPAMAASYGLKIPTANAAKGFGTGYVDHQINLIASRDIGWAHFDFNAVETLAGEPHGYAGAMQYGMALSAAATKKLTWIAESDGGRQAGELGSFGQALGGAQWSLRPWLVVDCAYTRAYTAGSPRQQFTVGWTWSSRPALLAAGRSQALRLLHRGE
jgi:hypothetical protein